MVESAFVLLVKTCVAVFTWRLVGISAVPVHSDLVVLLSAGNVMCGDDDNAVYTDIKWSDIIVKQVSHHLKRREP